MSVKSYLVRKSATAAKALSIFASEHDKDIVLERAHGEDGYGSMRGGSLADFLAGRNLGGLDDQVSLSAIDGDNQQLSAQINQFMPNFEDQRFQSGPMTRKR